MNRAISLALLSPLAVLALGGCGATVTTNSTDGVPGASAPSDGQTDAGEAAPGTAPLGGSVAMSDGLTIGVAKAVDYKPGEYAVGAVKGGNGMKFKVTLVNKGSEKYDPSLFSMNVSGGPDGEQCEQVYDSSSNIGGAPDTSVLPGKRAAFTVGFSCPKSVAKGSDLTVEVSPGMLSENPIFTGKAA